MKKENKSIIVVIISLFIFIVIFLFFRYSAKEITQEIFSPSKNDIVIETVRYVKNNMTIPSKIDEVTTIIDVTAEQGAIRYHYILSDVDTNSLSNSSFKEYLDDTLCKNKDTRKVLDAGINMEYSYKVENMANSYFVIITKSDCE
jgi:hypothetical protein